MTTSGYAAADAAPADLPIARPSVRERIGLEVEHLLAGLDIADRMLRGGDAQGALRTCAALVLCDPLEPRFQIGLATCALDIGLHAVAQRAASAAIALRPGSPDGYHLHAHASVGLEEYDSAIDDFTEALRLARESDRAGIARDCERMLARLAPAKGSAAPPEQDGGGAPAHACPPKAGAAKTGKTKMAKAKPVRAKAAAVPA